MSLSFEFLVFHPALIHSLARTDNSKLITHNSKLRARRARYQVGSDAMSSSAAETVSGRENQ